MRCHHYDAGRCGSCTWLEIPRPVQVQQKEQQLRDLLRPVGAVAWEPTFVGAESGFRNKAKMVVAGSTATPTLGILDASRRGVDLRDCPLHSAGLQAALPVLAGFVTTAALTPYDVAHRRGELKHLLVTESPDDELMVRFVLRSTEPVARIRKHLAPLLTALPHVRVVSVNLQPAHKAVLEGEEELLLHGDTLTMRVNGYPLRLRPQSFFQTNTEVAAALYRTARDWAATAPAPRRVWDLYSGVGGFAVHLAGGLADRPADGGVLVTGVELSAEAVRSARSTVSDLGLAGAHFVAADATAWALEQPDVPDLVVVNPPRRGIGEELAAWLEGSGVRSVLYSSCNATTLARDLERMPSLRPVRARLFDMFPHTGHYEVLALLDRS